MVAPKHAGGRPPKFTSAHEVQSFIDAYFAKCDNRFIIKYDKDGEPFNIPHPEPYTMSGLALALNLSRQGLIDYSNKDGFFDTIKRARQKVEIDVERRLMEGQNQTGAIFNLLNNFAWVNKQERALTGPNGGPIETSLTVRFVSGNTDT